MRQLRYRTVGEMCQGGSEGGPEQHVDPRNVTCLWSHGSTQRTQPQPTPNSSCHGLLCYVNNMTMYIKKTLKNTKQKSSQMYTNESAQVLDVVCALPTATTKRGFSQKGLMMADRILNFKLLTPIPPVHFV